MKSDKSCRGCIWEDECAEEVACEYYDNGDEQSAEEAEFLKKDFVRQWFKYVPREGQNFFES